MDFDAKADVALATAFECDLKNFMDDDDVGPEGS